ncbi:RNA polymerase factor sigma-70 [Ligilactobacillus acidipiscis DSM 15836]|nr:RNA polymerase factor sigma-70 [Ligilactobacillus acidipiscis DSM 15836]
MQNKALYFRILHLVSNLILNHKFIRIRGISMTKNKNYVANDLELITDILADPESLSLLILFQKYHPLVISTISAFKFRYYDFDDLKVEAMVICYQSVQNFELDRNVPFGSFFKANLSNYFRTLLRNQAAKKRHFDLLANSFESLITEKGSGYLGPDRTNLTPDRQVLLEADIARLPKVLSSLENQVMQMYCNPNPYSKETIANKLNISHKTLYSATSRCKKKTKKLIYS